MYRFSSKITNNHLILVKKKFNNGSCSAVVFVHTPKRFYAQTKYFSGDCPEDKPRRKSRGFLYGVAGFTVLTGAAIVYAKHTPKVRNFLQEYLPPLDKAVALAYQENTTYYEFASSTLYGITTMISGFIFGKEGRTPVDFPTRADVDLEKAAQEGYAPKDYKLPPAFLEPLYIEEKVTETPDLEMPATLIQTEKCTPAEPLKVHITKEDVDYEKDMFDNTKIAIDSFKTAVRSVDDYVVALTEVIETPPEELTTNVFNTLKAKREQQVKASETAFAAAEKARSAFDTLQNMLDNKEIQAPPENLVQLQRYIKTFRADVDKAEKQFHNDVKKALICEKFKDLTQQARNRFKDELLWLFPGVDLNKCTLDAKGEIDLLLIYCMKQFVLLQNELAAMQTVRDARLKEVMDCDDLDRMAQVRAEELLSKDRLKRELEYQKLTMKLVTEHRKKLQEELSKQGEVLTRAMNDAIKRKESEIQSRIARAISEANQKETVEYKKELAAMTGKLAALDAALKQQLQSEKEAVKAKAVWAAAEALLSATRRPEPRAKVDKEVTALEKAAAGDKLVVAVVKGIPKDAREKGIVTEKTLMLMFDDLEKTATSLALIGRHGAALPMYILSWIQSKLIFPDLSEIPRDELENRPTDFSKLDNFDIMHRARYYVDRNELSNALRYVNLLQGASRVAARCWVDAALRHLEVRQAAETVMAHAALSGIYQAN